jgi:hypothetical protein
MNSLIDFDRQSEVAIHFNNTGHNYIDNFIFCIFETNVINKEIRRSIETDLINIFKILIIKLLTVSINNLVYIILNILLFKTISEDYLISFTLY